MMIKECNQTDSIEKYAYGTSKDLICKKKKYYKKTIK